MTPFIKIPNIFSSRLLCTLGEAPDIVSTLYLSFVQNLSEGDEMEMTYEISYSMSKVASIFSLISSRQGDVLALCSPFKERDNERGISKLWILSALIIKRSLVRCRGS